MTGYLAPDGNKWHPRVRGIAVCYIAYRIRYLGDTRAYGDNGSRCLILSGVKEWHPRVRG